MKDLVYAIRVLRKSPAFTITATLSLALGIGANTVVFSVLNGLLLKPLPIADPGRVFFVNNGKQPSNSFPTYRALRDRNQSFDSLFAYRITMAALDGQGGSSRLWGYLVTGNYFQALGVKPAAGRFFTPAEDVHPNESPYAVLSYSFWRNRFGGDPQIAGREIRINGHPYTVLGVAPRGFHGTEVFYWPDVWIPMMMQPQIEGHSWLDEPRTFDSWIAGRLKAGTSPRQAEANLKAIAAQLAREDKVNEGMRLSLSPPGIAGAALREPTKEFAGIIMLLAGLVLLAACANLASLLAARAAGRERELAIRVSIGAGPFRIARQLLTECLALSVAGGAAGCALALALLRLISEWRAPLEFPVQFDVTADWRVFMFASLAAVMTGLMFGAGVARRAWKTAPAASLKGMAGSAAGRRWFGWDLLLPVQIALCCVLLTASLAAVRGLARSLRTPLGFEPDGAAVTGYDTGLAGYDEARSRTFQQRALEQAENLPGVESAAFSSSVPLSIDQSTTSAGPEGTTDFRNKNLHIANYYSVSPGYFRTAGTRLLAGREFTWHDDSKSPLVAIVNETFARKVVGSVDAVGHRFNQGPKDAYEIVGVVENGKYSSLTEEPTASVFFPTLQRFNSTVVLMARSRRPEQEVASELRQVLAKLDPHVPVFGTGSLRQMLGFVYLPMHAAVLALGAFGVLAMMLSITGIYGFSAFTVARRTREIGIRMAVGARPAQVLGYVFTRIGALTVAGAVLGLAAGIAAAGVLAAIVFGASRQDPLVIALAILTIALAALAAAFGPARRALRVDPMQSLRQN